VKLGDGKVQAVQDDSDLLAMLGGENVVEEGGFACAEIACSSRSSAAAMRFRGKMHTCHNGDGHLLSDVMMPRRERDVAAAFYKLGWALVVAACVHGGCGRQVKAETCDNQTTTTNFISRVFGYTHKSNWVPSPHRYTHTRISALYPSAFGQFSSDWPAIRHTFSVDDMAGHSKPSTSSFLPSSNTHSFKRPRLADHNCPSSGRVCHTVGQDHAEL
jgi:hypothetical protein